MKLLVLASTFPSGDTDPVPAFVKDQLVALKALHPALRISVLAPHDRRSETRSFRSWPAYDEYRFHYFWPFAAEQLAGRGILPALRANPLHYLVVPCLFLGEFVALLRLVRRLAPDVLYAHWFTPQAVVAGWVSRITGIPFVFTTHAADVEVWRRVPLFGGGMVRGTARRARAFTAVSTRSMQKLQRFFAADEWASLRGRAAIIPMGVALPAAVQPAIGQDATPTVILFMGRLVEKKGVQFLLQAYATARTRLGSSSLVIAGDGPLLELLRRQAVDLGIADDVRFAGFVSGAAKAQLLEQADICVVASVVAADGDAEGLPVSLLEGLAHGKLCIATAESGADDILTSGTNGFVVPQRSSAALAEALLQAAGLDLATRQNMQAAARRLACQFDWALVAQHHYEHLLEPCDRYAARPAASRG
jgi:glycosyltransferase involved in cell wall biosynthesis